MKDAYVFAVLTEERGSDPTLRYVVAPTLSRAAHIAAEEWKTRTMQIKNLGDVDVIDLDGLGLKNGD